MAGSGALVTRCDGHLICPDTAPLPGALDTMGRQYCPSRWMSRQHQATAACAGAQHYHPPYPPPQLSPNGCWQQVVMGKRWPRCCQGRQCTHHAPLKIPCNEPAHGASARACPGASAARARTHSGRSRLAWAFLCERSVTDPMDSNRLHVCEFLGHQVAPAVADRTMGTAGTGGRPPGIQPCWSMVMPWSRRQLMLLPLPPCPGDTSHSLLHGGSQLLLAQC